MEHRGTPADRRPQIATPGTKSGPARTSPVRERQLALAGQMVRLAGTGDAAANRVAARQHGLISGHQARVRGLGRKAIAARRASGSWQRLHARVDLIGSTGPSDRGRVLAALMCCGDWAVAGGASAGWLSGLTAKLPTVIEVSAIGRAHFGVPGNVRLHRPQHLGWEQVRWQQAIALIAPAETLLTIARDLRIDELEAVYALALSKHLITREQLARALAAGRHRPGVGRLRAITATVPSLTRSQPERLLLTLVRQAELPTPETNVVVLGKELDLFWPDARLGVEVDAFSTHSSPASFEDDRKVDADLEAADVRVLRFTRRRIEGHSHAVIARLAAVLTLRLGGLPPPRRS